jgi:hypothetical protein
VRRDQLGYVGGLGGDALPVDADDLVPDLELARAGVVLLDARDTGFVRADQREEQEQQHKRQHQVHGRPRRDHHDPLPDGLGVVGPVADLLGEVLVRVHPADLHVAARGDRADRVLGLPHLLAPDRRGEEERELLDPHAHPLGDAEVAQLVEDHEQREAHEGEHEAEERHAATPRATSRACASAA